MVERLGVDRVGDGGVRREEALHVLAQAVSNQQLGDVGHRLEGHVPEEAALRPRRHRLLDQAEARHHHVVDREPRNDLGVRRCQAIAGDGAPVVPDEREALERENVAQHRVEVVGEVVSVVAGRRLARLREAAQRGQDDGVLLRQRRDHLVPGPPRVKAAVDDHDSRAAAADHVVHAEVLDRRGATRETFGETRHRANSSVVGPAARPRGVWRRRRRSRGRASRRRAAGSVTAPARLPRDRRPRAAASR